MKNIFYLFMCLTIILSCSKENSDVNLDTETNVDLRHAANDTNLCHMDDEGNWIYISVNSRALQAHLNHGDVQLIDEDGDGWVTLANECGFPVDCDDTDPELTDNCVPDCCFNVAVEELNLTCWNGEPSNPILWAADPVYGLCSNCLPNCGYNTPLLGFYDDGSPAPEECRLYLVQLAEDLGLGIGADCVESINSENSQRNVVFGQQ